MSKLDELINELCPNRVEYKTLGEITDFRNGKGHEKVLGVDGKYIVVNSKFISTNGEVRKYSETQISPLFINDILIVMSDLPNGRALAKCYLVNEDDRYTLNQRIGALRVKDTSVIDSKFLYYVINRNKQLLKYDNGVDQTNLKKDEILNIHIPLPPLPVQEKIVNILDNFTELTVELKAELTAEFTARRKQYEYYRDEFYGDNYHQLLKLENVSEVKKVPLSDVGKFIRGKRFVKTDMINEGTPCIHYGELYTHYGVWAKQAKSFISPELAAKLRFARTGNIVIVAAGETIEDIGKGVAWLADSDVVVHDACYIFEHNLEPKYVSYFLRTKVFHSQIKRYISSGKISSISADGLGKALIPIPSIEVQKKIVSILDRFDALCNDLTSGLPTEIEARQKQYEYYRDKLLSFKECEK